MTIESIKGWKIQLNTNIYIFLHNSTWKKENNAYYQIMIKKTKETFYANESLLVSLRQLLGLEKDKMGSFFLKNNIKKIGDRTYTKIENGEKPYELQKFKDISFAFNSEFQRKNLPNRISVFQLIKKNKSSTKNSSQIDIKDFKKPIAENKKKIFTTVLNRIFNAENLYNFLKSNYHRKKVFNLGTLPPGAINDVEDFFDQIKNYDYKLIYDFKSDDLLDFSREKKILEHSSTINSILNKLEQTYEVRLYMGILAIPLAKPFPVKEEIEINDIEEFELCLSEDEYLFYYFASTNPESIHVKYEVEHSEQEIIEILDKYKVTAKVDAKKTDTEIFRILQEKIRHLSKGKHYLFDGLFERSLQFDLQKNESLSFNNYNEFTEAANEYLEEDLRDLAAQQQLDEMRGK